jgi:hypothetical protein
MSDDLRERLGEDVANMFKLDDMIDLIPVSRPSPITDDEPMDDTSDEAPEQGNIRQIGLVLTAKQINAIRYWHAENGEQSTLGEFVYTTLYNAYGNSAPSTD